MIHPETGKTADLGHSWKRLSRWAQAYEHEHGIFCHQRIANNRMRDAITEARTAEAQAILLAQGHGQRMERVPFVLVKDQSPDRKTWFEKQEVVARMKEMRARYEQPHMLERGILAAKHREDRQALWQNTRAATDNARAHIKVRYKTDWREICRAQRQEFRQIDTRRNHPFERAVYVFLNRDRLGGGKPLTMKQMAGLILKPGKLIAHVEEMHERERRGLARAQSAEVLKHTDIIMAQHRIKADRPSAQQASEREAQWATQREIKEISISLRSPSRS